MNVEPSRGWRRLKILVKRSRLLQIGLLILAWIGGEAVVALTGLPLPGGVLGFAVLVACLLTKVISPIWFRRGAAWLLDHLALFFVPAMVALVGRPELMGVLGLKLLLIVVLGTVLVMTTTALIVEYGFRARALE